MVIHCNHCAYKTAVENYTELEEGARRRGFSRRSSIILCRTFSRSCCSIYYHRSCHLHKDSQYSSTLTRHSSSPFVYSTYKKIHIRIIKLFDIRIVLYNFLSVCIECVKRVSLVLPPAQYVCN